MTAAVDEAAVREEAERRRERIAEVLDAPLWRAYTAVAGSTIGLPIGGRLDGLTARSRAAVRDIAVHLGEGLQIAADAVGSGIRVSGEAEEEAVRFLARSLRQTIARLVIDGRWRLLEAVAADTPRSRRWARRGGLTELLAEGDEEGDLVDMLARLRALAALRGALDVDAVGGADAARQVGVGGILVLSADPCVFCRAKHAEGVRMNPDRKLPPWHAGCRCAVEWGAP